MENEFFVCQSCGEKNSLTNNSCQKCAVPLTSKQDIQQPLLPVQPKSADRKKRSNSFLILGVIVIALISIITYLVKSQKEINRADNSDFVKSQIGTNGAGNGVNDRYIQQYNGSLIYEDHTDDDDIYISDLDGTNQRLLYNNSYYPIEGIAVANGYVYHNDYNNIIKTDLTNGNSTVILKDVSPFTPSPYISGNRLYFNISPYGDKDSKLDSICFINTDGTGFTKLRGASALNFTISDGWIYYEEVYDGYLYKISLDGHHKKKLVASDCTCINVVDDWVFFIDLSDNYQVKKIKTDGSEENSVGNVRAYSINIFGSWIYYSNVDASGNVYRIQIDDNQIQKLGELNRVEEINNLNIVGDWLYYRAYYTETPAKNGYSAMMGSLGFYKMRLDGSENQLVWSD